MSIKFCNCLRDSGNPCVAEVIAEVVMTVVVVACVVVVVILI